MQQESPAAIQLFHLVDRGPIRACGGIDSLAQCFFEIVGHYFALRLLGFLAPSNALRQVFLFKLQAHWIILRIDEIG